MACPYCQADATLELERATALGYRLFRCRPCRRTFNERTGTAFNHLQVPTDGALLVVLWCLRYKLSTTPQKKHQEMLEKKGGCLKGLFGRSIEVAGRKNGEFVGR